MQTQNQTQEALDMPADKAPILPRPGDGALVRATTMPSWTPAEAKRTIDSRPLPQVTFDPVQAREEASKAARLSPHVIDSNVVPGVDSIAELARALNNDPNLIYQFVHDNISYYPIFGVSKGALGALLDGAGSAFDQSMLMVALLRQAGFTANYVLGQIQLTAPQVASWLGCAVDQPSSNAASNIFALGGVPNTWTTKTDGSLDTITLTHCWVQVNIGGTLYVYDPSFKAHTFKTGINLKTASGYLQSDLLTAMQTGATIDPNGDFVQNLNQGALNTKLSTYATNLVSYIKSNLPDATMDDIVGGRQIVPATIPVSQTVLPYEAPGDTPTIWTADIPTSYKITVQVGFGNQPFQVFTSDQVYGRRLHVYLNSSFYATLALDGVVIATSTSQQNTAIAVSIKHNAYPNTSNDTLYRAASAGIGYIALGFGMPGRGLTEHHRNLLNQAVASGMAKDSEPVYGEAKAVVGSDYYLGLCKATEVCHGVFDTSGAYSAVYHNHVGLVLYIPTDNSISLDYGALHLSTLYMSDGLPWAQPVYSFIGPHGTGLEALVLKQDVNNGMSASTYVPIANQLGYKIFYTTPTNLENVRSQLVLWNQYAKASLTAGNLFSQRGFITIDSWRGDAWLLSYPGSGGGYISGYLQGGSCTMPMTNDQYIDRTGKNQRRPKPRPGETTGDPIDVFSGAFSMDKSDLSLGSGEFPYTLAFERRYDSSNRFNDDVLGLGWSHNFK